MLLFSTTLDIRETMDQNAFIQSVIDWNRENTYEENRIPNISWNGERNIRYGDDNLWLDIEDYRNENIIAIRYEKKQTNGIIWDTDYVMNFNTMKMTIQLDRSYLEDSLELDTAFSTPAYIATLIDRGYVVDDGNLPICREPIRIDRETLPLLADIINGTVKYKLPVIFVSKTTDGEDPVDIKDMAKRLKGVAHVLVQADTGSYSTLRKLTDSKNEYNGAIGIYFPTAKVGHEKYLMHWKPDSDKVLADKVIKRVIQHSNSYNVPMLYTWEGVNNRLLRDRYSSKSEELSNAVTALRQSNCMSKLRENQLNAETEKLRQKADESAATAQEYMDLLYSVDAEQKEMQKTIELLTRKNEALTCERDGLRKKLTASSATPLLYLGTEDEFFPGEIKEFVIEILSDELKNTKEHTRKSDVLGDIIRSNGGVTGLLEEKRNALKKILFTYTGLNKPERNALKDLGFKIVSENEHHKLVYFDDPRYWTTLACTPGDTKHGTKNGAMEMIRSFL